jgi:hypothetical protein
MTVTRGTTDGLSQLRQIGMESPAELAVGQLAVERTRMTIRKFIKTAFLDALTDDEKYVLGRLEGTPPTSILEQARQILEERETERETERARARAEAERVLQGERTQ